jgi:hypothetical protein
MPSTVAAFKIYCEVGSVAALATSAAAPAVSMVVLTTSIQGFPFS